MFEIFKKHHEKHTDRDLLLSIIENQHLIISQNFKIMSQAAVDLQTLVDQLKASQAATKTSLDAIKTGVATIVAGIPDGGLTADEVTALKASFGDVLTAEQANASEASDDAAAVAAAQPAAPTPPTDGTGSDGAAA